MILLSAGTTNVMNWLSISAPDSANKGTPLDCWLYYLKSQGATGETEFDMETSYLAALGYTTGTLTDKWGQFLSAAGYTYGGIQERIKQYFSGSAVLTSGANATVAYWKVSEVSDGYLPDLTGNGHDARFGSVGAARVINKGRAKYLRLPAVNGNYASAPDSAALSITGDIDLRAKIAAVDWTPTSNQALIDKRGAAGQGYLLRLLAGGTLSINWETTAGGGRQATSTASVGATDGTIKWVRAILDVDNGAGQYDVKFYTSDDGSSWTQLGTTITGVTGVSSIFDSADPLLIGARGSAGTIEPSTGSFYRAQIRNNILDDGTGIVFDADFTNLADGTTSFTESSANAATVTINSTSGADTNDPTYLEYTGTKYAYLPGVAGNSVSTPDSVDVSITGDITIDCKVACSDWTPSAPTCLVGKWTTTGNQRGFQFTIDSASTLSLYISPDGTATAVATSSVAVSVVDGADKWVRVTRRQSDGRTQFFTSDDGSSWTQLGVDRTLSAGVAVFDSSSPLEIGGVNSGSANLSTGKFYRVRLYSDTTQSTLVANFDASTATSPYATTTDSTGKVWTFNRAATGKKLAVVDRTMLLLGTDDYLEVQDQANLNFGDGQAFTAIAVTRSFGSPVNYVLSKRTTASATAAQWWVLSAPGGTQARVADGTDAATDTGANEAVGVIRSSAIVRTATTVDALLDGVSNGTTDASAVGDTTTTAPLWLGLLATTYSDMELVGAAIFRKALTPAQLNQVKTELGG